MKLKMPKFPTWRGGALEQPQRYCFQVYKAKDGYRWRMWAKSGRLVAESGEAYGPNKGYAVKMAKLVRGERVFPLWIM
jgi:uncharacterized protein YegP (UPF0339 family)